MLRLTWWNWPVDVITERVRTIWTGTPAELEQAAKDAGLLDLQQSFGGRLTGRSASMPCFLSVHGREGAACTSTQWWVRVVQDVLWPPG